MIYAICGYPSFIVRQYNGISTTGIGVSAQPERLTCRRTFNNTAGNWSNKVIDFKFVKKGKKQYVTKV